MAFEVFYTSVDVFLTTWEAASGPFFPNVLLCGTEAINIFERLCFFSEVI